MTRPLLTALIALANVLTLYLYINSRHAENREYQDFIAFYSAARLPAPKVYDLERQKEIQIQILGEPYPIPSGVLPFVSPPILLPLVKIVTSDNYLESYWRWVAVLIVVSLLCGLVVYVITDDLLASCTAVLFYPLFNSILQGQISPFLTLSVLLWALFMVRCKDWLAGLALSVLFVKPHLLLAFSLPTLFISRRAFASVMVACVVFGGLTVAFVGIEGVSQMIDALRLIATTDDYGANRVAQYNLLGLLIRLGADPHFAKITAWIAFIIALGGSCWLAKRDLSRIGVIAVLTVITAPHLHFHDLALLLLPMAAVSLTLKEKPIAFFPGSFVLVFGRSMIYVVSILLAIRLYRRKVHL